MSDGFNLRASLHQLTQVDRQQQDVHRTPIAHQDQTERTSQDEWMHRSRMPVQPDGAEGRNVDPEHRKKAFFKKKKRRKKTRPRNRDQCDQGDEGLFVDYSV